VRSAKKRSYTRWTCENAATPEQENCRERTIFIFKPGTATTIRGPVQLNRLFLVIIFVRKFTGRLPIGQANKPGRGPLRKNSCMRRVKTLRPGCNMRFADRRGPITSRTVTLSFRESMSRWGFRENQPRPNIFFIVTANTKTGSRRAAQRLSVLSDKATLASLNKTGHHAGSCVVHVRKAVLAERMAF